MTEEEIKAAAWKEFLLGAEGILADWLDEEGEYGSDADAVLKAQWSILADLKVEHP
jgi:hypothetical protein